MLYAKILKKEKKIEEYISEGWRLDTITQYVDGEIILVFEKEVS